MRTFYCLKMAIDCAIKRSQFAASLGLEGPKIFAPAALKPCVRWSRQGSAVHCYPLSQRLPPHPVNRYWSLAHSPRPLPIAPLAWSTGAASHEPRPFELLPPSSVPIPLWELRQSNSLTSIDRQTEYLFFKKTPRGLFLLNSCPNMYI